MSKLDPLNSIETVTKAYAKHVGEDMSGRSFKAWERELLGVIKFLARLPSMEDVEGKKWVQRSRDYYVKRHNTLIDKHPRLPRGYKLPVKL
jgi:hypothetical protein